MQTLFYIIPELVEYDQHSTATPFMTAYYRVTPNWGSTNAATGNSSISLQWQATFTSLMISPLDSPRSMAISWRLDRLA